MTEISLEAAQELGMGFNYDPYQFCTKQHQDDSRWEAHYLVVFGEKGKSDLLGFNYSEGLTEYQESSDPYDQFSDYNSANETVKCFPVHARRVTTTQYSIVKD